jgi:hypothetical protein
MITEDSTIERCPDVLATDVDDDAVMMNAKMEEYFSLNPVGREIWEAIAQPTTVSAICRQLHAKYDVDAGQCRDDVIEFLRTIHAVNLIDVH